MTDTFPHLDETVVATARYLATLERLTDDDLRAPSALPGWTRAHVVAHVARNADALSNLLRGAARNEMAEMYPSQEQRDAELEQSASRGAAELLEDSVAACGRWHQAANELHAGQLDNLVRRTPDDERTWPVRRVFILRRTEVEVHHADLLMGYTAADWPADFHAALMKRRARELTDAGLALRWRTTDTGETWESPVPEVSGSSGDLLWWLLGRGSGDGLTSSTGSLPALGSWA
jgi:maleylpyruvate isomerase